ncbi:MAG TPA: retroviral-like aspartic protease family protein [Tepidisphaeraceae bacterium]|jgi:aspartyl protease family protein|nr:retroviral-like aspartic protease family protein [Tepidisphaeraceae bacterium]
MGNHLKVRDAFFAGVLFAAATFAAPAIAPAAEAGSFADVSTGNAASAEGIFRSKGLTKLGFLLVIPQDAEVHTAANSVRALKSKLVTESLSRAATARAIKASLDALINLNSELANLDAQMAKVKDNPAEYNRYVNPYNETLKQVTARKNQLDELKKKEGKIEDSQSLYNEAVLTAGKSADAAAAAYAELAKDRALKAVIDQCNKGAAEPLKLGPSGTFLADAAFLKKCISDISADGIPVRMEAGVPVVEVTIHGKKHDMIWDSGASSVSLSAETAAEFGLKATDQDPVVKFTIADGTTVEARQITVRVMTVGGFSAENVICTISPPGKVRVPDLLGGTFQRHFVCRLDQQAGILHLTPIDVPDAVVSAVPSAAPSANPPPAEAPRPAAVKPPPAPASAGSPAALAELKKALLDSKWGWYTHDVLMTFHADGTVEHHGMHGTYKIAGPRTVILHISNGDTMTLEFNAKLTHYTSVNRGFGGDRYAE